MRISTTRWLWPELSPFLHSVLRERLKYQASPEAMVLRSASSFMWATINTSPVAASVATQVTRPDASNLGRKLKPSSRSESWGLDKATSHLQCEVTAAVLARWSGNETAPPDCLGTCRCSGW